MISYGMAKNQSPLFVRLPREQLAALDRLADSTGRAKQHLVSEFLADRLARPGPFAVGRAEVTSAPALIDDAVLTLDEVATLLKLSVDAVRVRAEASDLPGRRFGDEWRFTRAAVIYWLASGEPPPKRSR